MDGHPRKEYFDVIKKDYESVESRPGTIVLDDVKRLTGVIKKNAGAALVDLGDGVLCVEFHSRMNSIGDDIIAMLWAGIEETGKNFDAMVIANDGGNFSVGANLVSVRLRKPGRSECSSRGDPASCQRTLR